MLKEGGEPHKNTAIVVENTYRCVYTHTVVLETFICTIFYNTTTTKYY
jgi:hypothetical protein